MNNQTLEQLSVAIRIVPRLSKVQYAGIMGVLKAYYGHAGRPGMVGGSMPRHGSAGSVQSPVRGGNGTSPPESLVSAMGHKQWAGIVHKVYQKHGQISSELLAKEAALQGKKETRVEEWDKVMQKALKSDLYSGDGKHSSSTVYKLEKIITKDQLEKIIAKGEASIADQSYETVIVYDRNGKEIYRKDGNKEIVILSTDKVVLFKDNTLTHNHPSGGSFSRADIERAICDDMHSVRAVGSKYLYVLTKKPGEKWDEQYWWTTVLPAYKRASDSIYSLQNAKRNVGEITSHEASALHNNLVMELLSKELGLNYERRLR